MWKAENVVILISAVTWWITLVMSMPMPTPANNDMSMTQVMGYLEKYQYLGDEMPDAKMREMYKTNKSMAVHMALEMFQERYNLTVTGEADVDTIQLMKVPRCGVADMMSMGEMTKRKKRYSVSGFKWAKSELTYKVTQYPQDNDMIQTDVDYEIMRAFMVWQAVIPLTFRRSDSTSVDIDIKFVQPHIDHGDGYPLDGPGGTLAHAFFPTNGATHFDDAETWTLNVNSGVNLFQVAAHEFGHALGLFHSEKRTALMAPFYQGYIPDFELPEDDRLGIQAIYGRREPTTTPTTTTRAVATTKATTVNPPTMGPATDLCRNPSFDAITTLVNDGLYKLYGFKGDLYFLLENGIIADGYPRKIRDGWEGLPDNIDAALFWDAEYDEEWKWDNMNREWKRVKTETLPPATFIFKGDQYWKVEDMKVLPGYPKPISQWGLPADIDASFVWKANGKTYFFKGREYYRYTENEGLDMGYPRDISVWGALPDDIDTILPVRGGQTYFFSANYYYVYDNSERSIVHKGEIEPIWFNCKRFADFTAGVANNRSQSSLIIAAVVLSFIKMFCENL